jgi:hypothetical protein
MIIKISETLTIFYKLKMAYIIKTYVIHKKPEQLLNKHLSSINVQVIDHDTLTLICIANIMQTFLKLRIIYDL